MRLLYFGDNGKVSLTKDLLGNDKIPPYAILSHTWGDGEVTFEDLTHGTGEGKKGFEKIQFCMQQAAADGLQHSWVDTCCINKNDFTELQHAINSFFRWYQDAARCYVFLSDVSATKRKLDSEVAQFVWEPAFRRSRWFTRGWTLQELLAPRDVRFFSYEGVALGGIQELGHLIQSITALPIAALTGAPLEAFGVEERLRWTENRATTRDEDKAYSLLGIFGVFMPLIYGEGKERAFRRLRREIQDHKYLSLASVDFSEQDFGCIRSLSFPEQEQRLNEIHTAHNTCQWLSRDQRYKNWIAAPRGILWIKGNPGVGKSVLMKHAVKTFKRQDADDLQVSFFLHGQGTSLQKTPLGLFRALLNQLLPHYPSNLVKLTTIYRDRELRFGGYMANRWHWECNELQDALSATLVQESLNRRVIIFIDALDECGADLARHLLEYFSNLMSRVEKAGAFVKICLSSRHYPVLGLDRFPTISLEDENGDDIQWYVKERLREFQPFLKSTDFLQRLLTKARGAFQWVYLVTERMKTKIFIGGKAESLLKDLAICPESLNEMYAVLVQAGTASERHQMTKLLQWIMFAERPLSAQELREALAADAAKSYKSVKELRSQECWSDTLEDFERYVKHLSRGLVEFHGREVWEQHEPGGEDWNREAQLIHQSVADFLLETPFCGTVPMEPGTAHLQISKSCLQYISLDEVLAGCQLSRGSLSTKFPLAPYATRYIFTHIDAVEKARIDQSDLLTTIGKLTTSDTAPKISRLWGTVNPYKIGTPVGWPFTSPSELHILAGLGTTTTLSAFLDAKDRVLDTKDLHGDSPLHVALAAGHHQSAMVILDHLLEQGQRRYNTIARNTNATDLAQPGSTWCIDLSARNDEGETILDIAVAMQAHVVVTRLMRLKANLHFMDQSNSILKYAISNNNMEIFATLLEENVDLSGAVYFAVGASASDEMIVKLLEAGADYGAKAPNDFDNRSEAGGFDEAASHGIARSRRLYEFASSANGDTNQGDSSSLEAGSQDDVLDDQAGGNALHLACRRGLSSKVELLLSHGVSATSRDNMLRCPLHLIVERYFEDDERRDASYDITDNLLLYAPEAVEFKDINSDTPLDVAANNERMLHASLLLRSGYYKNLSPTLTAFFLTSTWNSDLWEFLLDYWSELAGQVEKLDLEQTNSHGQTIFWLAADNGVEKFVTLLLEKCTVDVNTRDESMASPLLAAVRNGHHAVVKILLEVEDINVNAPDVMGITPLYAAIEDKNTTIAAWLLERNDIDMDQYGEALHLAIEVNEPDLVSKLLATGKVDVNARDQGVPTLVAATNTGFIEIVEVLLTAGGIDVNAQDNEGLSPLLAAVKRGDAAIVERLLANKTINVNIKDRHGISPLLSTISAGSCCSGHSYIVRQLLAVRDIDIPDALLPDLHYYDRERTVDTGDESMLCTAIRRGDIRLVHLLVGKGGFDVNVIDREGCSALRLAVEQPDKTIFKFFVARSETNLDIEDAYGRSLLSWAAEVGNVTAALTLLSTGRVNLHQIDHSGLTPLQKAERYGHRVIATMLQARLDATMVPVQNLVTQQYVIRQPQPPPE